MVRPPFADWLRFPDAEAVVLRETRADRTSVDDALWAALATGLVRSRRTEFREGDDWQDRSRARHLRSSYWEDRGRVFDDWEGDEDSAVLVEIHHGDLLDWLRRSTPETRGRKAGSSKKAEIIETAHRIAQDSKDVTTKPELIRRVLDDDRFIQYSESSVRKYIQDQDEILSLLRANQLARGELG